MKNYLLVVSETVKPYVLEIYDAKTVIFMK